MKLRTVAAILLLSVFSSSVSASLIIIGSAQTSGFSSLLSTFDTVSVSTGGSGGEDRLTDFLGTIFVSTGGTGGEDRLSDIMDILSISSGGTGGEDRLTDIFDMMGVSTGGSGGEDRLTDLFDTVFLRDSSGTPVSLTVFFSDYFLSAEVSDLLRGYTTFRVQTSVAEPAALILLLPGIIGLVFLSRVRRKTFGAV